MKHKDRFFLKQLRRLVKNKKAQALVEFALVLPILLLLVLGMIEYGWLLNGKITLNSAAREGARIAAVLDVTPERKQKVYDAIIATTASSGITITIDDITVLDDTDLTVNKKDVVITVNGKIEPIIGLYVTSTVTMSTEARMRRE